MKTLLFGVIPGPDIQSANKVLAEVRPYVDGVELRLDYFKAIDLATLREFIERCEQPVMLTVRRETQGGSFIGTEKERLDLIESLCALGPDYIDLEYDVDVNFRKKLFEAYPKIIFISSYHDFEKTPDDIEALYAKVKSPYAHIVKLAFTARSTLDALRLLEFVRARSDKEKIIGLSMGEEGKMTRILAPVAGCYLTFASSDVDTATAPGQIVARELHEIYHFRKLNRATQIFALIGDPVTKSLGHLVHNAVFDFAKQNAVYLRLRVTKEELQEFVSQLRALPFKGLSVTMPLKELIIPFLSQVSIQTQVIGACNTVHITDEQITGYNTDGIGALNALERRGKVFGRHLVLVGAGGSAKAIIFEASQRGAHVTVINRTASKAVELAAAFGGRGGGFELFPEVCKRGYDIMINCTSVSDIIDEQFILPEKIAMDIVHIPKDTPFLIKAARKKCRIVYGYEMFVRQAVEQQRIWFPKGLDFDKVHAIIEEKVTSALAMS